MRQDHAQREHGSQDDWLVHSQPLSELDDALLEQWRTLADRSAYPNAYLSPEFIQPAAHYLEADATHIVVYAWHKSTPEQLEALGVFSIQARRLAMPLKTAKLFRSKHTFLTGLLCREQSMRSAVSVLIEHLRTKYRLDAIECRDADESVHLSSAATWFGLENKQRAVLQLEGRRDQDLSQSLSKSTRKSLKRKQQKLEAAHRVHWRTISGTAINAACIERFLALENTGWKAAGGTALASHKNDAQFFSAVTLALASNNQAFFCELLIDGDVVCSSSNFIGANHGFAFKIGRNPAFDEFSIGMLTELELLRHAPRGFLTIDVIDSGSQPGSYLESLWLGRRTLHTGYLALSAFGRGWFKTRSWVKAALRRI